MRLKGKSFVAVLLLCAGVALGHATEQTSAPPPAASGAPVQATKNAVAQVGPSFRDTATQVGHGARTAAKDFGQSAVQIGHAFRDAFVQAGQAIRESARQIGQMFRSSGASAPPAPVADAKPAARAAISPQNPQP